MSATEKELVKIITEGVSVLPAEKREYILGYAEGVIAMADQARCKDLPLDAKDSARKNAQVGREG